MFVDFCDHLLRPVHFRRRNDDFIREKSLYLFIILVAAGFAEVLNDKAVFHFFRFEQEAMCQLAEDQRVGFFVFRFIGIETRAFPKRIRAVIVCFNL